MGSRILSRSFDVEKWQPEEEEEEEDDHAANQSMGSAMDVDEGHSEGPDAVNSTHPREGDEENDGEEDGDHEEALDSSDTAMVPMADMLNARFGSENVRFS